MKKPIKVVTTANYVVEDYKNPPKRNIVAWRKKKVGSHVLTLAILNKKGDREGRTVVTSVWHPKTERKTSSPKVQAILNRINAKKRVSK
jgi:hypothetical protein